MVLMREERASALVPDKWIWDGVWVWPGFQCVMSEKYNLN